MAVESLAWAIVLVGVSKLVDLGFDRIDSVGPLVVAPASRSAASLLGFLGAGIYEEAVFRLALIPMIFGIGRLLQLPEIGANVLAVTSSSLLFSLAHHIGAPSEVFTWYAFVFRWAAGIFFAWVFVVRGFGVAVGTHTLYDVLVGYLEWML
jgi:membrane protease YdiL (CAAX protease family)